MQEFPEGRHFRFRKMEFWSQGGMISMLDHGVSASHPGFHRIIPKREFKFRYRAFKEEIVKHLHKYTDERIEHEKLLDDMEACLRDAQKQGDPLDPKQLAHMMLYKRKVTLRSDYDAQPQPPKKTGPHIIAAKDVELPAFDASMIPKVK